MDLAPSEITGEAGIHVHHESRDEYFVFDKTVMLVAALDFVITRCDGLCFACRSEQDYADVHHFKVNPVLAITSFH